MGDGGGKTVLAWIGGGCIVVVLLVAVVVIGGGYAACRGLQNWEEELKDPVAREEAALEALGANALPDGYHAMFGVSMPFNLAKTVVLTDRAPGPDGKLETPGDHVFIYFELAGLGEDDEAKRARLRGYFLGEHDDASVLDGTGVNVNPKQIDRRGEFQGADGGVLYLVFRGEMSDVEQGGGATFRIDTEQRPGDALGSLMLFQCEGSSRLRLGVWLGPDPAEGAGLDGLDLAGTTADESAMQAMVGGFHVCR